MRKEWVQNEDGFLYENYSSKSKDIIIEYLNRGWCSIQHRASRLGLKRVNIKIKNNNAKIWSGEEIKYLIKNYKDEEKDVIIDYLKRGWSSIQNKAFLLKLKRGYNANSSKLLNETNESYYWLGFIIADGHFNKNKTLQINLVEKDFGHLKKFSIFVEYKKELKKGRISIGISNIWDELFDLFKISNNKTYHPCDLDKLSGEKMFSFIIGFIDGNGCINKMGYLAIKCHKSWLDNIDKMLSFISDNKHNKTRIISDGLAFGSLTKIEVMKSIKNKVIELRLPVLQRKWDRVDLTKLSKRELTKKYKNKCYELFDIGLTVKDVINKTRYSSSFVYKIYTEYIKELDIQRDMDRNINR